jgi:hypothetical protein
MTRKRPYQKYLKLVTKDGRAVDEMADFDRGMLADELDEILGELRRQPDRSRDRALIEAWLADISKTVRQ